MFEKANYLGVEESFEKCFGFFLDEMNIYMDDRRLSDELPMDTDTIREMEEFMNEHLPSEVRKNLKKLKKEK